MTQTSARPASEQISKTLARFGFQTTLTHTKTMTSAVTSDWKIHWNPTILSRDIWQNFFDGTGGQMESIKAKKLPGPNANRKATYEMMISSPVTFELKKLFFLGSDKDQQINVGGYGEGFKAAALLLLRDHQVIPINVSANQVAVVRFAEQADAETGFHPLEYDFYEADNRFPGSAMIMPGCGRELATELETGYRHFFYDSHPALGKLLDSNSATSLYQSNDKQGYFFYAGLMRGIIADLPLVLVLHHKVDSIQKSIGQDRDRKPFSTRLLRSGYKRFIERCEDPMLILKHTNDFWPKGHPILSELAAYYRYRPDGREAFSDVDKYCYFASHKNGLFSRDYVYLPHDEQREVGELEAAWLREGQVELPNYFKYFGAKTAVSIVQQMKADKEKALRESSCRPLTSQENSALKILIGAVKSICPTHEHEFFRCDKYMVCVSEAALGMFRQDNLRYKTVYLNHNLFECPFSIGLSTLLHELSHVHGDDGSRRFTDALTTLIETLILHRSRLDNFESKWIAISESIATERALNANLAASPLPPGCEDEC
ncbi:MAG TPA: hypothetical protein PKD64_18615 [Pirellulaceae bacterium]|nr:hypothetical protein [Pirellulaceae bacterium]HMO94204.1 hypothetical protein [Pirellulaceae bacterium]HMP71417.1 hypothetical protein [Pirellulaceae bacterium]